MDGEQFQRILKICFLILLLFLFIGFAEKLRRSLNPTDSSAIFGGKLENGYDFTGYIVSNKGNGDLEICGAVLINQNNALTAAHCADGNSQIYFGINQFTTDSSQYIKVTKVDIHPNWINNQPISGDIALLKLEKSIILNNYAEVAKAEKSCDYTVVGYGKQDENSNYYPLRKSADLCINSTDFSDGSISFTGLDGGLCFGDSGSPIFKKGTNQLVSIASRIDACYTKNFGTGADLSEQINSFNLDFNDVSVQNSEFCGSIDIDDNGILDKVDLNDFLTQYRSSAKCSDSNTEYLCGNKDSNKDGVIDIADLSSFALKYSLGKCN